MQSEGVQAPPSQTEQISRPLTLRHLGSLENRLRRKQLVGSHAVASAVVKLLREVVAGAKFATFDALLSHIQDIGLRLEQAAPNELVIGNITRRVLKFLREEYATAFEGSVTSTPHTPSTSGAAPAGTIESPNLASAAVYFSSAPPFRRQSTTLTPNQSSSKHTSLPAFQPSVSSMLDLLGHHGPLPSHTLYDGHSSIESPPGGPSSPMSPASHSPAISRNPSYVQVRRALLNGEDTEFSRKSYELKPIFVDAISELRDEIEIVYEGVGSQAAEHVHNGEIILTLGHSRTVEAFLKAAARKRKFTAVVVESAPTFSGRQLADALAHADPPIDTVLIPDAAVFALMSRCTKVVLGAHAVLADGSLLALSGSLPVAKAAKAHLVPLVVCAGMFKFCPRFLGEAHSSLDWGSPAEVILPIRTPGLATVLNPYFDRVPNDLVSLFVTNIGGHPPSMCSRLLNDMYGH